MSGMQPTPPHTVERCQLLLEHWRSQLQLSPRDQGLLGGQLQLLDRQLQRLQRRHLRIALFGRVGVGKSSLINALIRRHCWQRMSPTAAPAISRRWTGPWRLPG